jgi:hypothetical protein
MRRLPHQAARHSTIDHGDASDGVFLLLHLWVLPSTRAIVLANDLLPPSSLWTASRANGSLPANGGASTYLGLKDLHAQEKGGPNRPRGGPGRSARSAQAHPGPVRSPLRSCGPSCIYAPCPLHLHHFDDVIIASKMEVLLA